MRLLVLAVSLSALAAGSFWTLTEGPLAPSPTEIGTGDTVVASPAISVSERPARPASPERPPVQERLRHETYAVTGRTADAVLRSLVERGPRAEGDVFFGLTQTELDVRYNPTPVSGGCLIEGTEVDLDVVVTLPEWLPAGDVDPALLHDWSRFRRSLSQHEHRHRVIALGGAEAAYKEVAGLYRSSCEAAVAEARGRLERLGIEISAAHRRYDSETGHGKTEGAVWPVR
ncbi:DUF922 domain-containing protein [Rubrivirga sp.]|uniref:DUF922 domain-containing protein n=1 Tax=Rubrivirga sp. TaxID=1885344 RepID=UPI003B518C14